MHEPENSVLDEVANGMLCRQAAREGEVANLQLLAACGASADALDYNGRTALHMAAANGRTLAVYSLLCRCCCYACTWYGVEHVPDVLDSLCSS